MSVQSFTPMVDAKPSQPETKKREKPSPEETQVAKRVHQAISPKLSPGVSMCSEGNVSFSSIAYDKKPIESPHESPAGSGEHRYFDLNVEKVLEDWEIHHALREVIANAIDEQKLTHTVPIRIFKDDCSHWHIRDFGRGLQYQHLTQNENQEKLEKENLTIGKFGVGLKDALATFDRKSIDFRIQSRHGDITIAKTLKHNFEDLTTLHAKVLPPSDPNIVGTDFIFTNISDKSVKKAQQLFLIFSKEQVIEKTIYGEILLKNSCGHIYINGLKIAEEENFLFSYNITSMTSAMRKALNRERSHVGRTAYTPRIKTILLSCKSNKVAQLMTDDLKNHANGLMHDELKWIEISSHAVRILSSVSRNVLFMTAEQLISSKDMVDEAQNKKEQIVVVPNKVAERISRLSDLSGEPVRDLSQYVKERNDSFKFSFVKPVDLTKQEKEVFDCTEKIFDLIGGRPPHVQNVLISETMRPDTLGCWDDKDIIILRSQLENLQAYSATLLHEAAHALSGASDISRKFEEQLTLQLGMIASRAIKRTASKMERSSSALKMKDEIP